MNRWMQRLTPAIAMVGMLAHASGEPAVLGTSRVIQLPRAAAAYGTWQHSALPLSPGEVVLTFDDGPMPQTTPAVLEALARQGVRATFFMTGRTIEGAPELARRVLSEGHSAGLHGHTHANLAQLSSERQREELDRATEAYRRVLGQDPASWRYPFLASTPVLDVELAKRRLTVMSADLGIEDWIPAANARALADRLVKRLDETRGGIVLLHDAQAQTAEALPLMLEDLRQKGFRIVHLQWTPAP